MNPTPTLMGFLLGAIIGVLVTDLNREELGAQATWALRWVRIRQLWTNPQGQGFFHQLVWAASRGLRLEWAIFSFVAWLVGLGFWAVAAITHCSWLDPDWLRDAFIGSLIGAAAAPWVWLHFA